MSTFDHDNFEDDFEGDSSPRRDRNEEIERFKELLRRGGNGLKSIEALEEIISYCFEKEKFDEALTFAAQLVEYAPYSSDSWMKKGMVLNNLFRYQEALECYDQAIALNPNDSDLFINRGITLDNANRNDEARALLDERVRRYPDNKYDRYNLGVFLLKDNKFEGAVNEFKAVLAIDPAFSSAVYNLAATYVNWGVAEQEELKKAGKEDDKSYQAKYKEAIPFLEKVIEEKPNDVQILELLGQVYANLGMADKAKAAYDKADAVRQGKN
ncbi:MAG: tetratricopeptide repeat protein [Bacteroidetes bacterium]|nr:tetratricopeptide repeat protein [Bacteroidota bacterium]